MYSQLGGVVRIAGESRLAGELFTMSPRCGLGIAGSVDFPYGSRQTCIC